MSRYKFKGYTITNCGYHQPDHCVWWEAVNENGEACFHGNTLREVEFEILDYEWEQKMKKKDEEIEMLKHGKSDASRNTPFGNAAAMREAMMKIYKLTTADCPADEVEIANICFKALSAPARNCDRLKTGEDAKYMFLQIAELPEGNGDADMREWYRKLIAWLFSPVGEGAAS